MIIGIMWIKLFSLGGNYAQMAIDWLPDVHRFISSRM